MSNKINLMEELKNGKIRVLVFNRNDIDSTKSLYLIELLDKEKYKSKRLIAVDIIDVDSNVIINPIGVENLAIHIANYASTENLYSYDNFIFPDDEAEDAYKKGEPIIEEFDDCMASHLGVNYTLDEYFIDDTDGNFFDTVLVTVYNFLMKDNSIPIEQVIDIEFPIAKDKLYVPKFYMYYKRNIAPEDLTYEEIYKEYLQTKDLDRYPREFTMISHVVMTDYRPEYLEYLFELYTKIKYIGLVRYKYNKLQKEIELIKNKYQNFLD